MTDPLAGISETELIRLARIADPLLAGKALLKPGHRPAHGRPGHGVEFLDHKEYTPGDDLRSVDWRASARSPHLQVRRFRDERAADWYLCLDASASMQVEEAGKWRLGVQLAACFAYLLLHLGSRVGLLVFDAAVQRQIRPGRGHRQYARIAADLRAASPPGHGGGSRPEVVLGRLGAHNPVVLISDFLREDAMRAALSGLLATGRELHALQVREPPVVASAGVDGPVELRDSETGGRLPVELSAQARSAAAGALAELSADLFDYCRRRGVAFTATATADGWRTGMLRHLSMLRGADA